MPDDVQEMHTRSGLLAALHSTGLPTPAEAEHELLDHCNRYAGDCELWLAGRNAHQHDRRFLARDMPALAARLHPYRHVDVCHNERTARAFRPRLYRTLPRPETAHRALPDAELAIRQQAHLNRLVPPPRALWTPKKQ